MNKQRLKVLAIDDNADNLTTLKALMQEGLPACMLLTAMNGSSGIKLALAEDPDVILLDIVMPGMDGYEVCRRLKANEQLRSIPVIFLTALRTDRDSRIKALDCGTEGFLAKPVDEQELVAVVHAMAKVKAASLMQRDQAARLNTLVLERTHALQQSHDSLLNMMEDVRAENTVRKEVEAELLEEKTNSEAIFESSPIALFVLDDKTNIVRVNTRAVDMFGGRAVAALQHRPGNALGCVHSLEDPRGCGYSPSCPLCPVRNAIKALLANGGELNGVDVSLDLIRDGLPQKVWMEIGAKFVQIEGRRHVCIAMVDITARKQAEAEQQESNERFRTLFDSSPDPVWIIDNQRFVECNQAAIEMLGYPDKDSLKNIHPSELSPQFQPDGEESYSKAERMMLIAKEKGLNRFEWVHRRRDQSNFFAEVTLSAITLQGRQVLYCMWRDVTERKKAAEAATQLSNAKNKFISVVSHELRSPLATIKEATSLVLERVLGPLNDEQKEMLDIAKININRLGRLVNNVLIYQKMDAGKMMYDFLENDVNEIIQEAYRNIVLATPERNEDLVMNLAAKPPRIKCDKDKILQVLLNLISNGIKYSERGPIVIETRLETREIAFSVRDSGQGIYPEEIENIFMPFSHGRGRKTGGTGLGLAISKEIVHAHNGKMWVESEPGKGSTFYFTLPL